MIKIFLALVGLAVVLVVAALVWGASFAGPAVLEKHSPGLVEIDTRALGEYCLGLSRVSIVDSRTDSPVWQLDGADIHGFTGLCEFELHVGENPVLPFGHLTARVEAPPGAEVFHLSPWHGVHSPSLREQRLQVESLQRPHTQPDARIGRQARPAGLSVRSCPASLPVMWGRLEL